MDDSTTSLNNSASSFSSSAQVTLEQKNARSLEEQITKLRHELNQAEAKIGEKEKEFDNFKSVQKTQPEVRLQQQLHILTLEKHELEKKAEAGIWRKVLEIVVLLWWF